jgi:hypothetical protein
MFIAYAVVAVLLAVALVASARAKLVRNEKLTTGMAELGVRGRMLDFLAACEIAGAVGLVAGLFFAPLGIAAAVGVVLYFIGAVIAHLRVGDKAFTNALVIFLVAAVTLWLRTASA